MGELIIFGILIAGVVQSLSRPPGLSPHSSSISLIYTIYIYSFSISYTITYIIYSFIHHFSSSISLILIYYFVFTFISSNLFYIFNTIPFLLTIVCLVLLLLLPFTSSIILSCNLRLLSLLFS